MRWATLLIIDGYYLHLTVLLAPDSNRYARRTATGTRLGGSYHASLAESL